ncbi:MAG: hypothetical protein FJ398_02620 [Verrucomicrobia bacterium]|nr:hypothetical protein [Verrucomicrobiota bacterium]
MALTDIHSEDRLVQKTFADHLRNVLGWESVYAHNEETFGPNGTLGRANEREVVLVYLNMRAGFDNRVLILDSLYGSLPRPPFTEEETDALADRLYSFAWQRSNAGTMFAEAA